MPRSSRSKSHKQSKHSSKDASSAAAREYSGSDEDVRTKDRSSNGKDDGVSVRISKDSVSGERRKHGKDLSSSHGNGDVSEKVHGGSDRWNGGGSDEKGFVVNIENKELLKSKDFSKVVVESKSKSSRRHDADSASVVIVSEKDDNKTGSVSRGEKRKSEKDSARKDSSLYKENKEPKDKDRVSDRGRKSHPDKHEAEGSSKQVDNLSSKRGKEVTEWPIEEDLRNPELEKELEKRMRRRGEGSSDKDKYLDDFKRNDRSKDERHKDEGYDEGVRETRQKDEKHREDSEHDRKNRDVKHRGESERYTKHRDDKYREDGNKDTKYKDDKYVDIVDKEERSRDGKRRQDDDKDYKHKEDKHRDVRHRDDPDREKRTRDSKYRDHMVEPEAKRLRDDSVAADMYHRKTNNRDGSPGYDDRVARYKDDKDRRRGNDKDDSSDYRSRSSMKEQRSESEKRSSAKVDSGSERGRPGSRYSDVDITAIHSRRRSSPSGTSYPTRDHNRVSKQEEGKYPRDHTYEDRARHNVHSSRDYTSAPGQQSDKKVTQKDDNYIGDLSGEKRMRPESRSSPQVDKSPSSTSNERRNLIRSDARRSLDLEEPGVRSGGSKDTFKDGRGSRELGNEAQPDNDFQQVDNDNTSVSSPFTRNSNFSEDDRNKSSNRHRRMVDPNLGRAQGNWKNVPNWPPPMSGGYIPFQHVPPPLFHPLMQQFPPPMFGRPPMKLNPGMPYHVSEHGRPLAWRNQVDESVPSPMHGWDANNSVFGDESHLYGRLDWDRRAQMGNRVWDQSGDMWKAHNAGAGMEVQLGAQKDGYSAQRPTDENWAGQTAQPDENEQNQSDVQPETLNLDKAAPDAQNVTESPKIFDVVKEGNNDLISKVYLSRIDVSKDLTQPELYEQCTSMMDLDQEALSDEFDCKILFLEEGVEANVTDSASLFAAINDSVFQKAMLLYKKQKEELHVMNNNTENDGEKASEQAAVGADAKGNDEPEPPNQEGNVIAEPDKPEAAMDMEVDLAIVEQEVPVSTVAEVKESLAPSAAVGDGDGDGDDGDDLLPPCNVEGAIESRNDEKNGGDGGGSLLVLSGVSTAGVAVMPTESIEFGSVNLSRIQNHHSPESTH